MSATTTITCDVLVVGAGPAGLATALGATRHGAGVLVVERHPGTSIHPRATGVSTRSMELFRTWDIARAVRAAHVDVLPAMSITRTLVEPARTSVPFGYPTARESLAVSPALPAVCPQDHIEPLLVAQVRRHGGEVRFDTELTGLRTGPGGVHAELANRADGAVRPVRARYVVGADGPRSTVRRALGIGTEKLGTLGEFVQVLFRADLDAVAGERRYCLYTIEHPDAAGVLRPVGAGRWAYVRPWHPGRERSPAEFSTARWTELIRTATGVPDLRADILGALPLTMAAEVATAFRAGPGFLVGDAAHPMTPVAGLGMNTGIHDGHNLGWKLAWAARGWAGAALLDSYSQERRPVGLRNALRSLRPGEPDPADGLPGDLGVTYRSAVIADDGAVPASAFAPSGRPGERAPHQWIELGGRRMSTLDLFDGRLTLLAGHSGMAWCRAVAAWFGATPLAAFTVGGGLTDHAGGLTRRYGIGETGAVLIRPDGHIAWRSTAPAADPAAALGGALDIALGRIPVPAALAG